MPLARPRTRELILRDDVSLVILVKLDGLTPDHGERLELGLQQLAQPLDAAHDRRIQGGLGDVPLDIGGQVEAALVQGTPVEGPERSPDDIHRLHPVPAPCHLRLHDPSVSAGGSHHIGDVP